MSAPGFNSDKAARLRKLREEVAALEAEQGSALAVLHAALMEAKLGPIPTGQPMAPPPMGGALPQWVALVAGHADSLRDALAPFDSGVRVEKDRDVAPSYSGGAPRVGGGYDHG